MTFCVKCVEKEAMFEVMFQKMHNEIQELKKRLDYLESENEKLAIDLAFYNGDIINMSCKGE